MRNHQLLNLVVFLLVPALWFGMGCNSSNPSDTQPFRATYEGELHWDKVGPTVVGNKGVDTVEVGITGINYTFFMITNKAGICDSRGEVSGFGTSRATFVPTEYLSSGCDTLRTLRGDLDLIFSGDSLYMNGNFDFGPNRKMFYDFRMVKTGP
ncbi:MAG: hypothetical protein D6800_05695 [Candidatus Zixiibacteriota bacterium]|nr:MAG: hypothetical protein D6800_05695 [candidate division Zixibacteria bacterium]